MGAWLSQGLLVFNRTRDSSTNLILSSHPLQNAPKPWHSLIKSSLVVIQRHQAIR